MAQHLLEGVDAYVATHRDRILAELFSLIGQPSISARGEGMQQCADLLSNLMRSSGVGSAELIATAGYPVVYGEVEGARKDKTLLVYGHYDVQAPEPLDAWISPPFEPEIRDGKIYGRGSSDNKAQLFIFLKAVEILRALTGEVPLNVRFLFEGEEEIGSPNLADFARANRERLRADATVFSDGHRHQSGRPTATLGVKGMLYVELSVETAGHDHHSMHATSVPNPVWRLVWALNALRSASHEIIIPGFHDSVRTPTPLEAAAIEAIPEGETLAADFGVNALIPGRLRDGYHWNLISEPTLNIAGIQGGYSGPGSKTVLPGKASAKLDIRLVPDQKPGEILEKLSAHLAEQGFADVRIRVLHETVPSRTPMDHRLLAVILDSLRSAYGSEPIVYPSMGGVGPNYIFTDILDQPCFGVPHASFDQANHSPNENMCMSGLFNGLRSTVLMLSRAADAL